MSLLKKFGGVALTAMISASGVGCASTGIASPPTSAVEQTVTDFASSAATWIGSGHTIDHDWSDARIDWEYTLEGPSLEFLFRALPTGKTFGDAYVWRLSQADGVVQLTQISRHYDGSATPQVKDTTLRTLTLAPATATGRHRLTVETRGDLIVTRLDDLEIDRTTNADHAHGTVGVRTAVQNGAVIHGIVVTPAQGRPTEERFVANGSALSGGTVTTDGLLVGSNATDTDIVFPMSSPAPLLRREFNVPQTVVAARLTVAAGGFPRIELNGSPVGEAIADGFTAYDKRVLYRTYDVTDRVRSGDNAIGVELGRGWYGLAEPVEWYWHLAPWHAEPNVRLELDLTLSDGSHQRVVTDRNWTWRAGPTLHDSIYAGERYDARQAPEGWSRPGFKASDWAPVALVAGPAGRLEPALQQPIAVTGTLIPKSLKEVEPGVWVFDFGSIFAGRLHLRAEGPAGSTVSLVQHEQLRPDGTVFSRSGLVDTQIQTDRYTFSGQGVEEWRPAFGYRGFRYVELRGFTGTPTLGTLTGEAMHSDVASRGEFESSNPLLNQIQSAARRTILNNMHGMQTDTPTFEKNGWTGDAHGSALASALNFDVARVWSKWMGDFRDAQSPKGEIPEIVPSTPLYGYEGSPGWRMVNGPTPSWDAATFVLPDDLYQLSGDTSLLDAMYDTQKRLVDYTRTFFTPDFLYASHDNSFLGEYSLPMPPMTPEQMAALMASLGPNAPPREPEVGMIDAVSTAYFFHETDLLARNATRLGKTGDAREYTQMAEAIRTAFNARYWDAARGEYRIPGQTAYAQYINVLPVAFGLAPAGQSAAIMKKLADDYAANNYHFSSTGVFSGRYVLTLLSDYGYADTAYRIASSTDEPSWGWWLAHDIDTMLEGWGLESRSRDHHYWGSISSWFYQGLAGIRPGSPGYGTVVIRPSVPTGLDHAQAWLDTPRGRVSSGWTRDGATVRLNVTIPQGGPAEVWCPGTATAPAGATRLRSEPGYTVFAVQPGDYQFICR